MMVWSYFNFENSRFSSLINSENCRVDFFLIRVLHIMVVVE